VVFLKVEASLNATLHNSMPTLSFDSNVTITCNTSLTLQSLINKNQLKTSIKNLRGYNLRFIWQKDGRSFQASPPSLYLNHHNNNNNNNNDFTNENTIKSENNSTTSNQPFIELNNLIYYIQNDTVVNSFTLYYKNYRIEYYLRPTISTRLFIIELNEQNIGNYTCKFREQNITINLFATGTVHRVDFFPFFLLLFIYSFIPIIVFYLFNWL
jgi:hypothetical protein